MIPLDKTTRSLEVVLGGAVTTTEPKAVAVYYDVPATTKAGNEEYRRALVTAQTTGATAVELCPAPSLNSVVRNLVYLSVNNLDSVAATVTLRIDDNGTSVPLVTKSLLAGQTLVYEDAAGWNVI